MAKTKAEDEPKAKASGRSDYIRVRMSVDFKAWFEGLAAHDAGRRRQRISLSDTIDEALVAYARRVGYAEAPPPR